MLAAAKRESIAPMNMRRPMMKERATNGAVKNGFLNLAVKSPITPVIKARTPPARITLANPV